MGPHLQGQALKGGTVHPAAVRILSCSVSIQTEKHILK